MDKIGRWSHANVKQMTICLVLTLSKKFPKIGKCQQIGMTLGNVSGTQKFQIA